MSSLFLARGINMKVLILAGLLLFAPSMAQAQITTFHRGSGGTKAYLAPTQIANIKANLNSTSYVIPANFVGWSDELRDVINNTIFVGSNSSLVNLIKMTGGGYIRFGADSCDTTGSSPGLTQAIANNLASFMAALGPNYRASYCVDLAINDPTTATTHTGYIVTAFGAENIDFEIGNEPAGFLSTAAAFGARWSAYYTAMTTAYPTITFVGPSTSGGSNLQDYQNATGVAPSSMAYVTQHKYLSQRNPYIPTLAQVNAQLPDSYIISNIAYAPGKLRINEANGTWAGGTRGFSDRMINAYWYVKLASYVAGAGGQGVDFHNGLIFNPEIDHLDYYNSFKTDGLGNWYPTPVFYGEYLFSRLAGNTIVSSDNTDLDSNAVLLATKNAGGTATFIVANGNPTTQLYFRVDQTNTWKTASVLKMSGTSCLDPNPKLGGAEIGAGGSWTGSPTYISKGTAILLNPCEIAVVTIQ